MTTAIKPEHRIEYLDSSRGVAATTVLFQHFFGAYGMYGALSVADEYTFHAFLHGEGAVFYFFVLSGFVLSQRLVTSKPAMEGFRMDHYLVKRAFRLYPLVIACALISFIFLTIYQHLDFAMLNAGRSEWVKEFWREPRSIPGVLQESTLLSGPPLAKLRLMPQDWTLRTELVYSLLIPVMCLAMRRGFIWLIIIQFCFGFSNYYLLAFTFGVIVAHIHGKGWLNNLNLFVKMGLIVGGFLLYTASYNFLVKAIGTHEIRRCIAECTGAAFLLCALLSVNTLKRFFSNRILLFLGRVSFGIYLVHMFLLILIIPLINIYTSQLVPAGTWLLLTNLLILLLFTIAVSTALYYFVELPGINAGKRIVKSGRFEYKLSVPGFFYRKGN